MRKLTRLNEILEDGRAVKGDWELASGHEIRYKSLDKDESIKIRGPLIAAEPDALTFALTEKQSDQKIVTSAGRLTGQWKLDSQNRIVFEVERESGKNNILTFKNAWKVSGSNEIVYTYERISLKTKIKKIEALVFKGYWDLSEKNGFAYLLGTASDSAFRFRGAFQTKSILAKAGQIRYQAGVETMAKRKIQTITLFGKWVFSRDGSLFFEMEYPDRRKKALIFGGEFHFDKNYTLTARLKDRDGEPLGLEVIFTRDFFGKNGQAFVRLQRDIEESRLEAGMRLKW